MASDDSTGADSHSQPLGYQPGLDGVRAVAILCVMGSHLLGATFLGGGLGVDMFFVLSGFLISTIVLEEMRASRRDAFGFRNFYIRRMLRLFPALYTMLAALALYTLLAPADLRAQLLPALALSAVYLGNFAFLWGVSMSWLGHTWSLALEEQFYLVWPAVLVVFVRRRRLVPLIGLLLFGVLAVLVYRLVWGVDPRAYLLQRPDTLMVGCLLALLRWRWPEYVRTACKGSAVGGASFVALLVLVACEDRWIVERDYSHGLFLLVSASTAVLIGHVVCQPIRETHRMSVVSRLLSTRPLTDVGRISYGLYLWHYPAFLYVDQRTHLSGFVAGVAKVGFAFALALISWFVVERRALRLKHRFASPSPERAARTP